MGTLEVEVVISARRRTVSLTIERDARIVASVPPDCSRKRLTELIKVRAGWIHSKLAEREEAAAGRPTKDFVSGEGFQYLGRSYRLRIVDQAADPVELIDGWLELRRDRLDRADDELIGWYRRQGQEWLPDRARPWSERIGVIPQEINVRRLGYRWGSCSVGERVNIHWAVMQLPVSLIDYVLVHELAHLRHRDHSRTFWKAVERALPDFAARRAALDGYGTQLWLP